MKKVLITGSNGFLGKYICQKFTDENWQIVKPLRANIGSINSQTDWSKYLKNIDCVIHLAGVVHMLGKKSNKIPYEYFYEINTLGTKNLAKQAAEANVKHFIFISSIGVNGVKTEGAAFDENSLPNPIGNYSRSKYEAEIMLFALQEILPCTIIRPPLIYGAGVKANFLSLLKLVKTELPLPFSSINNKRDMIFAGNLASIVHKTALNSNAYRKILLASDDGKFSTPELIQLIAKYMKKKSYLIPCPVSALKFIGKITQKQSLTDRLCDDLIIDKKYLQKTLSWKPKFPVEYSIEETVKDFLQNSQ